MPNSKNNKRFAPSKLNGHFDCDGYSFSRYVDTMRDKIEQARIDLDDAHAELIIDANCPFEWVPQTEAAFNPTTGKIRNGILLIHGLFDSPNSMLSIAEYYRQKNFLVRTILLPGHGTVPGDLLNIQYQDWLHATAYGVNSFREEVDELYISGFSTGATLALHHVLTHPEDEIKGLILFAPALKLQSSFAILANLNDFMIRKVAGIKWYSKAEDTDYAKYQSFTFNSGYQVYMLAKEVIALSKKNKLTTATYFCITTDDEVISSQYALDFLHNHVLAKKHCLIYSTEAVKTDAPFIEVINSNIPDKNILNYSHVSLPIAPDHPHYGSNGDYQDFQHYKYAIGKHYAKRFNDDKTVFAGAISRTNLKKGRLKRLTYNPNFSQLMQSIDDFCRY